MRSCWVFRSGSFSIKNIFCIGLCSICLVVYALKMVVVSRHYCSILLKSSDVVQDRSFSSSVFMSSTLGRKVFWFPLGNSVSVLFRMVFSRM